MGQISKQRRRCRSKLATHRFNVKQTNKWQQVLEEVNEIELVSSKGRTRTCEENLLIFGALRMVLTIYVDLVVEKKFSVFELSWNFLDKLVASNLGVKQQHVCMLRRQVLDDGSFNLFSESDTSSSSGSSEESSQESTFSLSTINQQCVLNEFMVQSVVDEVNRNHAEG